MAAAIAAFSLLVILFVSASARFGRAYLNGPIIFLLAGGIVGRTLLDAESVVGAAVNWSGVGMARRMWRGRVMAVPRARERRHTVAGPMRER